NILVSDRGGLPDFANVLDFGLVRDVTATSDARLTREGVVAGTPQYLAPETIRDGTSSDPRSDIYALGAVSYYLLTATPVFAGDPMEIIQSHINQTRDAPSSRLASPLPEKLARLVLELHEKDPARRPASANDLIARLDACDDVD